ncbi:MAG: ribbon-helix-helix domain-containing protein [Caulobacter sp.]|nr:ribbon-helix-helix domain-containing protein [Caulobacter sp.]
MAGLIKRSVSLAGHATSLALEPEFWAALEAAAARRGLSLARLISQIDDRRADRPLASACRVFALQHALSRPPKEGDAK